MDEPGLEEESGKPGLTSMISFNIQGYVNSWGKQ